MGHRGWTSKATEPQCVGRQCNLEYLAMAFPSLPPSSPPTHTTGFLCHTYVLLMKHARSMPPSSPEPPSVLLTAPALPVSKQGRDKASSFGQYPSQALSLKGAQWLCHFLSSPLRACCVNRQIMTRIFRARKDRRTVSVPIRFTWWSSLGLPPVLPQNPAQQPRLCNPSLAG